MSGIIAQNILDSSGLVKAQAGGGAWNFIKKITASADSTISFVDGTSDVDLSTYNEYLFTFKNMHAENLATTLEFQVSTATGSSYGVSATSVNWRAYHREDGANGALQHLYYDKSNSTDTQPIMSTADGLGIANDESGSGYLCLYGLNSTTFVKLFTSVTNSYTNDDASNLVFNSGYFNTTSAIDAVQFTMPYQSGTIQTGDICLYGLST